MPTLKAARGNNGDSRSQFTDFPAVWCVVDPSNIVYDGNGKYSYAGSGENDKAVGLIKTFNPLDSSRSGGISSFEVIVSSTGEEYILYSYQGTGYKLISELQETLQYVV